MVASRLLQRASKPNHYEVTRDDAAWIHGRGKDFQAQELFSKRVLLFGDGSLGAFVSEMLSQSGVRKLSIVDPQKMAFANASHHVPGSILKVPTRRLQSGVCWSAVYVRFGR